MTARRRSCAVTIQNIPSEADLVTILNTEPQWSEGLISMSIDQGSSKTATLVYSAAAFAEAFLFRCTESLNVSCGLKLSLAPQQSVRSADQVTPLQHQVAQTTIEKEQVIVPLTSPTPQPVSSTNTNPNLADRAASESSDDDCIVVSSAPVKQSTNDGISNRVQEKRKLVPTSNTNARKSSSRRKAGTRAGIASSSSPPMTRDQQKFLVNTLQTLSKRKEAIYFAQPVTYNQMRMMNIPHYPDVIKKPMDLRTMEEKLKSVEYGSIKDLVADFAQMVENTVKFNGPYHGITKDALDLKIAFDNDINILLSASSSSHTEKAQPMVTRGRPRKWQNIEVELHSHQMWKSSSHAKVPKIKEPDSDD